MNYKKLWLIGMNFHFRNSFIFEIDDNGTLIWEQPYRSDGNNDYWNSYAFYSIDVLAGGGYVAAGFHDAGTSDEDPPVRN